MLATFSDIMREWKRMCDTMDEKYDDKCCDYCPLHDQNCGAIWEVDNSANWDLIEKRIKEWSRKNPPKVYPTVIEAIKKIFNINYCIETSFYDWACNTRIPESLAKKLDIDPIEDGFNA